MDQTEMDVDQTLPSSSSKRLDPFLDSSSSRKRSRISLPDDEMAIVNQNMNALAITPTILETKDIHVMRFQYQSILQALTTELGTTSMKRRFIPAPKPSEINQLITSFNDDELEQWTDGLRRGLEKKDWAGLLEHPKLHRPLPEDSNKQGSNISEVEEKKATEGSWVRPYKGKAADTLWDHIQRHYNPNNKNIYAHFCSLVQSSGMGKSRTVDQLGKSHLSIPINLREASSTGFPPADHGVREFLTRESTKDEADLRASCFIEALFLHTRDTLMEFDQALQIKDIASRFRACMTDGQTATEHNEFRRNFYRAVVRKAEESLKEGGNKTCFSPSNGQDYNSPPSAACQKLIPLLKGKKTSKSKKIDSSPLVILAFDEAHTLTNREEIGERTWSNFSALRYVLRTLRYFPVFSLFLSTTGKISQFTSPSEDPSRRIAVNYLKLIRPFTDLGFDIFASAQLVIVDGSWELTQVIEDSHMTRLGRPLFKSRYDAGDGSVKDDIVRFAMEKLLNTMPEEKEEDLNRDQSLACLSHRLPIEFVSTNYISPAEKKQVEGHLRVCLRIDAAFESMTTVTPSEPLLSEAAYAIMALGWIDPLKAFKSILEGFSIHKGDRGEFVVMLLLTLARDLAVGPPDGFGRPQSGQRSFKLAPFMCENLFKHNEILGSLWQDFPDAVMHFNHFIKLHDFKSVDRESLLLLMTRGAGVLCANNQRAIDGINVFLKSGPKITFENLGIIIWQVKNDSGYTSTPDPSAFESMDPKKLKILKEHHAAVPVIRIFFALASRKHALHVTRHDPSPAYDAVIYDIWIAGLSPEHLNPIDPQKVDIWDGILQASYGWKDIYRADTHAEQDLRRTANPGAADDSCHWSSWAKKVDV